MSILEYIREAFTSLFFNKMRSILSLLGIIIGISSVVILVALIEGLKVNIIKEIGIAQNIITIKQGSPGENMHRNDNNATQSPEQLQAREQVFSKHGIEEITKIMQNTSKAIVPIYQTPGEIFITFEGKELFFDTKIVDNSFFSSREISTNRGTLFTEYQKKHFENVVIVGHRIGGNLGGGNDPLGKKIMINNLAHTIIGILPETKNHNIDYSLFLPASIFEKRLGSLKIRAIEVHVTQIESIQNIKKDLGYFLMKLTGAKHPSEMALHLETNEAVLTQINKSLGMLALVTGGIASISLLVGGIGIMNIMLVSVTERTREIGIRKAIGARRKDIIIQFLTESSILTLVGGILSLLFSFAVGEIVHYFFPSILLIIKFNIILLASGFSIFIGIIFGLIPAWKAAKMNVIDALKFE